MGMIVFLPITDEERMARVRLAACYRVFDYLGWTESLFALSAPVTPH